MNSSLPETKKPVLPWVEGLERVMRVKKETGLRDSYAFSAWLASHLLGSALGPRVPKLGNHFLECSRGE